MPPWFLQRVNRLLLVLQIADAWHGVPRRVFAPHRGFSKLVPRSERVHNARARTAAKFGRESAF
jgi:hypothetical protein